MDIVKIIDKYGPEIAKTLKLASTQVYGKVLWYVQINGAINLINLFFELLILISVGVPLFKWMVKKEKKADYNMKGFYLCVCFGLGMFLLALIVLNLFPYLSRNISKIVFPEYWIVNQIINKVN
jgi:hypothetical protein